MVAGPFFRRWIVNLAETDPVRSEFAADPDFRELLEEFAAAMPVRRDGLVDAHRRAAYDLLQTRAHQLKGAGGGFGFPRLSELAADLEKACQGQNPAKIAATLEAVVRYLNRITV
jgi:HPt (histidine-containing phosphotransfer) domain-containing protein